MARLLALLLLVTALLPAAAFAQSNPFGPLPQAPPAETPAPPEDEDESGGETSRETMFLIGAGVLVVFFGIGMAITRDARRNLTEHDRELVTGTANPDDARRKRARDKQRARAKTKAQRQARRKARR